jgi:ribosomal RNA-processing protein 12
LCETFTRVTSLLESALSEQKEQASKPKTPKDPADKMPPTTHTLVDLVITMSIYLPRSSFSTLFSLAAVVPNDQSSDPQLIKKAYKLLPRLASTETGIVALKERNSELQTLVLSTADKTPPPARRDRLLAIHEVITYLPTSDLHFIPSVLSEVVLGCKESNEKARSAAFTLLVHLAKRTFDTEQNQPGTVIRNSLAPHMPDDAPDAPATIEEFFTMVSAGLAGSSPHMVAASVTALSRLLFEFHTQLPRQVLSDLVQTIDLFLTSNNREIVRSVLGFVKVAVVALPEDMLRPRLDSLIPNLLVWSKEHKGRLKMKVKGILDRLIRRVGATVVEELAGDADRKMVVAIRKERERKKRKKKEGAEHGDEDEDDHQDAKAGGASGDGKSFSNAFDKAVYGSDFSDESGSDDASEIDVDEEGNTRTTSRGKQGNKARGSRDGKQYIRELSPESNPLDLLAPNALANISSTKPNVRFLNSGPGSGKKRSAKFDADGKLLLGGSGDDHDGDMDMDGQEQTEAGGGISAYVSAVSGPDAVRRGQKGKLKIGQSGFGKKKSAEDGDGMDVDDDDEGVAEEFRAAAASKGGNLNGRRGLGVQKTRGGPGGGRVDKRRGSGRGSPRSGRGGVRVGSGGSRGARRR